MAALLAVAMMFQMLPMMAFAADPNTVDDGKAKVGNTQYDTLREAVLAASDGDTITLGEGVYSLGDTQTIKNVQGWKLTFKGAGAGKTTLQIRAPQTPYVGDGYCDYSLQNSDSIIFQDMTVIGSVYPDETIKVNNYQGLIRVQHITLENCEFKGRADYWGYTSTTFNNVTFYAPGTAESGIIDKTDYSLWTYTGKTYTFKDCTFNSNGRTINVYRNRSSASGSDSGSYNDVTVYFENCTVNSIDAKEVSGSAKTALNINDSNREDYKYIIRISGDNTVNAALDSTTCSRVFGFGGKAKELIENSNSGRTEVYVNGKHVWGKKDGVQKGELKTHEYSAGEADQAYDITRSAWRQWDERNDERDVTRKCQYCGWEENYTERASVYSLQYNLNGGTWAEGANYDDFYHEKENVTLAAAPSREGYTFVCWKDAAGTTYDAGAETVLQRDTVLTAQWADPANGPILTVEGGTITAKKDGAELTLNIQEVGDTQKTAVPAGAEVTVELNKDAIPQNMNFDRWTLDGWTLDDEMLKNELDAALNQETIKFTMPDHDLSVEAVYRETAGDSGDSSIIGTVVIGAAGAALLGWGTYQLGTECLMKYYGLPYFPSNRSVLAMMLWEDAGKPMPSSTLLYPDVGQKERDMDLQHAARWAMENELMPDLNPQKDLAPEEVKFYPDNTVSKISALRAWRKAQELKQKA